MTFNYKVEQHGLDHARRFSAEPGRSQHQLGTTFDISSARLGWRLDQSMGDSPEGRWLAQRATEFGFALSYPRDSESITGYAYEPWHFRFIGHQAADELAGSGLILEQYLEMCAEDGAGLGCPRDTLSAPEPNHGWIGGACETADDCAAVGTDAVCLTDGYTGGTCSLTCSAGCPDAPGTNALTFCAATEAGGFCHSQCDEELFGPSGCRAGYVCEVANRPSGTRTASVCMPQ